MRQLLNGGAMGKEHSKMGMFDGAPRLVFPTSLTEKYRPVRIQDFIGLEKPKRVLSGFLSNPFASAWLFWGPPGTGKTTMGVALADQLPAQLQHIPSQRCNVETVEHVVHMCWYVPLRGKFNLVLVDEADRMTPEAQLSFLSKLDATAAPPQTIFIFTCNDTLRLEPRFLSRCHSLSFRPDDLTVEILAFLEQVWRIEKPKSKAPDLSKIAEQVGSNVRDALVRLEVELLGA